MPLVTFHAFDSPGAISDAAEVTVTDAGATSHTLSASRAGVAFQNTGNDLCWFGGDTVSPATGRGNILLPRAIIMFTNVQASFSVYFKCAAGESTTIGIIETL